ncbi:hypothetical protein LIA77_11518 [Sarocladium implicatum]|nr:hypothetical protein LIA77_11518 [Sarocladium implicatum]
MHAKSSMTTTSAIEHSADWYDNDVLDATPAELLAIEYICCYCPEPLDTRKMLADKTNQDDNASQQQKTGPIWLVNEKKEAVLQMSPAHPMYPSLMRSSLDHVDESLPDDLILPFEYSAQRMQQMIRTVRGDSDLQQECKVWWSSLGGRGHLF